MIKFYCDASFNYNHTDSQRENGENVVRGKIAVVSEGAPIEIKAVDKVMVGLVPGLRQYINILELTAVARAVELAIIHKFEGDIEIFTDSRIAAGWAHNKCVNPKIETEAHRQAIDYLKGGLQKYPGKVMFYFVPRERNPAGHLLEAELEKEQPHAL